MRPPRARLRRMTLLLILPSLLLATTLSACGEGNAATSPTVIPRVTSTATPQPGTFYFTTDDGATLSGAIVGTGTAAIVLSSQDGYPGSEWAPLASQLANWGYLVMTYNYRGIDPSQGHYDTDALDHDLRAAIDAVRAKGATKVVLMGAGGGGLVTAKVSVAVKPAAMVILSMPITWDGLAVSDDEMGAITAPKLFFGSTEDRPNSSALLHRLYDAAPQPKEMQLYPGAYHGVELFSVSATKADFLARLFAFLEKNAPAK